MGTLVGYPQKRASFIIDNFPAGLDLAECKIERAQGVWRANSSTSFRMGQAVMLNSDGEVVVSDGTQVLGVAKANKVTQMRTLVVDQAIVFGTSGATKNLKPNIVASSYQVRTAVSGGGSAYTETTDYTVNTTNGTITHVGGGGITTTETVYVTYTRTLTEDELAFEGKNFWQSLDEVTIQDLRVTVIEAPAMIFTTEFDTSRAYSLTGANSNIYVNSSGIFTNNSSSTKLVGTCIQLPMAGYPFLGINFRGQTLVNT